MSEFDELVSFRAATQERRVRAQVKAEEILLQAQSRGRDQLNQDEDDDFRLFADLMRFYDADLSQMDQRIRATLTEGVRRD